MYMKWHKDNSSEAPLFWLDGQNSVWKKKGAVLSKELSHFSSKQSPFFFFLLLKPCKCLENDPHFISPLISTMQYSISKSIIGTFLPAHASQPRCRLQVNALAEKQSISLTQSGNSCLACCFVWLLDNIKLASWYCASIRTRYWHHPARSAATEWKGKHFCVFLQWPLSEIPLTSGYLQFNLLGIILLAAEAFSQHPRIN